MLSLLLLPLNILINIYKYAKEQRKKNSKYIKNLIKFK